MESVVDSGLCGVWPERTFHQSEKLLKEYKSARKKTSASCAEQTLLTPIENKKWAPDARVM